MDIQNTTIHNLSFSLNQKKEDLDSLYKKLGARIFQDEEAAYAASGADVPEGFSEWKAAMKEREAAASTVFEIKDKLKRLQDLAKVSKDLEKSLSEEKKKLRAAGVRAASALWAGQSLEKFPAFDPVVAATKAEKAECEKLEEKQRSITNGVEAGKTLGRMMAQFRGAGVSAQLYYRRNKFEQAAADAMEALVAAGGAEKLADEVAAAGSSELSEAFAPFMEAVKSVSSLSERVKKTDDEKASAENNLAAFGAAEKASRRLEELHAAIKEKDAVLDNMCSARARDYCAPFFDKTGGPSPGSRDMASDPYSALLFGISAALSEVAELERKIEVVQTEIQVSALDKSIKKYNDEIDDSRRKIEELNARIEKLEKNIGDASVEKAGLETYLGTLSGNGGGEPSGADG